MKRWICGIAGAVLILYALYLAVDSVLGILISLSGYWSAGTLTREWRSVALSATTLCLGVILVKKARGPKATPNEGPSA